MPAAILATSHDRQWRHCKIERMKPLQPMKPLEPLSKPAAWWSHDLGEPSATGSSNGVRFAYFPERHRLAVSDGQVVKLFDTGSKRISGFLSTDAQELRFDTEDGRKGLSSLTLIDR